MESTVFEKVFTALEAAYYRILVARNDLEKASKINIEATVEAETVLRTARDKLETSVAELLQVVHEIRDKRTEYRKMQIEIRYLGEP
jgi:hypothetical protein